MSINRNGLPVPCRFSWSIHRRCLCVATGCRITRKFVAIADDIIVPHKLFKWRIQISGDMTNVKFNTSAGDVLNCMIQDEFVIWWTFICKIMDYYTYFLSTISTWGETLLNWNDKRAVNLFNNNSDFWIVSNSLFTSLTGSQNIDVKLFDHYLIISRYIYLRRVIRKMDVS